MVLATAEEQCCNDCNKYRYPHNKKIDRLHNVSVNYLAIIEGLYIADVTLELYDTIIEEHNANIGTHH